MRLLLLLVLFVIFTSTSTAQKQYAPLHAQWQYEGWSFFCDGYHQEFRVVDERIIQGKDCSIIHSLLWDQPSESWVLMDSLAVWENDDKVYFLEDNAFYLLYDFSAEIGDTVWSYEPLSKELFSVSYTDENQTTPTLIPYIIDEINSIQISGIAHKTFDTSPIPEDQTENECVDKLTIIENIGSTSMGFAGQGCFHVTSGCFGQIVCYENYRIHYESGFLPCDWLTTTNTPIYDDQVKIYPNPSSNVLNIDNNSLVAIERYQILGFNGQIHLSSPFSNQIDIRKLPAGVYLLQMYFSDHSILHKKIVVVGQK